MTKLLKKNHQIRKWRKIPSKRKRETAAFFFLFFSCFFSFSCISVVAPNSPPPSTPPSDAHSRYTFLFSILWRSGGATSPSSICQFMDVAVMSASQYTLCAALCCVNKREQAQTRRTRRQEAPTSSSSPFGETAADLQIRL